MIHLRPDIQLVVRPEEKNREKSKNITGKKTPKTQNPKPKQRQNKTNSVLLLQSFPRLKL